MERLLLQPSILAIIEVYVRCLENVVYVLKNYLLQKISRKWSDAL